jgi:hypothetical protein
MTHLAVDMDRRVVEELRGAASADGIADVIVQAFRRWRDAAIRRRSVDRMTAEQRRDLGLVDDPRRLMVIDARLMADLMSLR